MVFHVINILHEHSLKYIYECYVFIRPGCFGFSISCWKKPLRQLNSMEDDTEIPQRSARLKSIFSYIELLLHSRSRYTLVILLEIVILYDSWNTRW